MNRKAGITLGLLTLAVILTTAVFAETTYTTSPVTGRVTAVDTTANTVTVSTPTGDVTFTTDTRTMVMQRGVNAKLMDLKVGDEVTVSFTNDGNNRLATHVDTVAPGGTYSTMGNNSFNASNDTFTGRVTSVDVTGRTVTIETATGTETYRLGSGARIVARNGSSDFSTIRVGDQVRIVTDSDGSMTAQRIELVTNSKEVAEYRSNQLPRTASRMPLIGVAGLMMIGLSLALGGRRTAI